MQQYEEHRTHQHPRLGDGGFPTLVLADAGSDMWLATVHFSEPPEPRTTFHFRGQVWEVTWRAACGCRAEPALM